MLNCFILRHQVDNNTRANFKVIENRVSFKIGKEDKELKVLFDDRSRVYIEGSLKITEIQTIVDKANKETNDVLELNIPLVLDTGSNFDIFLSYSWGDKNFNHGLIKFFAETLSSTGLNVWFDAEQMNTPGSNPARMKEGIKNSTIFICILSECYIGKLSEPGSNCKLEFDTAQQLNKEYIFIEGIGFEDKNLNKS